MRTLLAIVILIVVAGAGGWYWHAGGRADLAYRTAAVKRGELVATISSTGTLEPEEVIDVGAQVAGLIVGFGKDSSGNPIDYRSPVEPDMVLARIDDTVYRADVDTATAELAQAKTSVLKGEADLAQAKAKLLQAENSWNRAKKMGPSDALSQNDFEMYQADYETAKANVQVADAEVAQAHNSIDLSVASLNKAKRNLDFCTIRSPVKGVIIDRRVNIGQTVVSSLNAPSLFLIAKDLTRMQIWVAVNEADVGRIKPGSPVTFTCDTFPDQVFQGTVGKVRLNATMTQNVVMYTVEVRADNPDGILLPYLSAKVQFEVARASDVLSVPNSALRWYPSSAAQVSPAARSSWKPIDAAPPGSAGEQPKAAKSKQHTKGATSSKERHGTVWVKDGDYVRPVEVTLGLNDGVSTAVVSNELADGTEVITGETTKAAMAEAQKNPFLPQIQRR
jgi:HlyD family secretion protein